MDICQATLEVSVQEGFEDDECFLYWNEDIVPGIQMVHRRKGRRGKKPEIKKEAGIPGQKEMEQQSMKEKGVDMDGGMPFSSAKGNTEQ